MVLIARDRIAELPWLHYLTVLTVFFLLPAPEVRRWLFVNLIVTFFSDTELYLRACQDPSEPPLIPHPYLPFVGHLVGLFWHGASYWELVNRPTQYPIFTLQTLHGRTIGVTSPSLAASVQRASKNTSFYGIAMRVTRRLVSWDSHSDTIINHNLNGELGHREGLVHESHDNLDSSLAPGPALQQLSTSQLETFASMLNDLAEAPADGSPGAPTTMMEIVKRVFTLSNALTLYGPDNPFARSPSLVPRFWTYEAHMVSLLPSILPSLTARTAWKARRDVNRALEEYVEKERYRQASPLIQRRVAINLQHGVGKHDVAHFELIFLFAVLGNAVPTAFWLLSNIYSRPELLGRIREETRRAVVVIEVNGEEREMGKGKGEAKMQKKKKIMNVTKVKQHCPLLLSTYRETLRSIANLASVRLVLHTHTLTAPTHPPYTLKKGSIVQIASGVIHSSEEVWGPDAKEFVPERFIASSASKQEMGENEGKAEPKSQSSENYTTKLPKNVPSAAFRAFGGGSVICPGRHFALTEIVGFVALFVNLFDVEGVGEGGKEGGTVPLPERDGKRLPLSVMKPVVEPRVRVKRREAEVGVGWGVEL